MPAWAALSMAFVSFKRISTVIGRVPLARALVYCSIFAWNPPTKNPVN
jgi:hypothetical protein